MSVLEAGKIFERYRIIRQLGNGISGESYEAEDIILLRKVTLKLIHPWAALSDAARRQFFREMQGISILSHPYLASMLDYGEISGKLYVARRYISSGSLLGNDGRLWFRPPLNISDAIHYGYQLAQALEYIHKHGYLHGSLSFANILVSRGPNSNDEPGYAPFLLADVGLANFVRRFGEPELKLLPITAAPEQLGQRVTQASDQFALAVLIYFWLTGRPPYLGTPEEIEELKLTETITPLLSLNPRTTIEQDAILRRALTVYPEDRYPSVLAFAGALLATLPPQSQRATEAESTAQLAAVTQTEPHEALKEVKIAPATEPELIQPTESASIIEPEAVSQTEATTTTESETESEPYSQPQFETSPESTLDSETESVESEPPPAEPLSSIEPVDVSEPSSPRADESGSSVASLETQPASESESETEPTIAESQVDVEDETQPTIAEFQVDVEHETQPTLVESEPDIEHEPVAQPTEDIPQLQQMPDSTQQPTPEVPQPAPDPIPQPVPDVPQPSPTPDVPEPTPDPVPQPAPDPIPQPAPDIPPQVPDPLPQIVPDVPQPLPEPDVPQSTPEPAGQSEPLAEEDLPVSPELVSYVQDQELPASGEDQELVSYAQDQELPVAVEEPETTPLTRLVINSPYTEEPYEVLVEHDETTIGRAGSSDVLLDHDNSTSRHHALLKREGDNYVLYDRRSANGVFVNGQMLMGEIGYVLEDGDHISIGNYELIFRCKRPTVPDEAEEATSEVATSWSFF